jgi:dipeptidyl aminopeptidase/acylaminoacyl peptidase
LPGSTASTALGPATPSVAPGGPPAGLKADGVPPLDGLHLQTVQAYGAVSGHHFLAWHPVLPEMLVAHRRPDGNHHQLYRLRGPMNGPAALEPLTLGDDAVVDAAYEPQQGQYILVTRAGHPGSSEATQILRLNPQTRAAVQITRNDERHTLLGWVKAPPPALGALALVATLPMDHTALAGTRSAVTTHLWLVDPLAPPQTDAARRLLVELPGAGWHHARVSPDSKQLAITEYLAATETQVWLIDLATGRRTPLLLSSDRPARRASYQVMGWSADGTRLLLNSNHAGEFMGPAVLDIGSRKLTAPGGATEADTLITSISADGRTAAVSVNHAGQLTLQMLDLQSGALAMPPASISLPGSLKQVAFHPRRNELAVSMQGTHMPPHIWVLATPQGPAQPWTVPASTPGLRLQDIPNPRMVHWTSFDGRRLSGRLHLPAARFAGPRPVLLWLQAEPDAQHPLAWNGRLNALIETLGMAVLQPHVRGSSGYGKTFSALDDGRRREDTLKDIRSALDWVATQPGLDARKVVVMGESYGGYLALAASAHLGERIAGAVSMAGITNFVSHLQTTESYSRDLKRAEYGDESEAFTHAFLQRISPLAQLDQIKRPLLLAQGRLDPRVPWQESQHVVHSLRERGVPVWHLLADNEGHGFARRENLDYFYAALLAFVQRTLQP